MNNENRTQKTLKRKKRRKKRYLLRFVIFLIICAAGYYIMHLEYFDIDAVSVVGNDGVTDAQVVELSEIKTGESIFDFSTTMAQRRIKKNIYIKDVDVRRALPNRIEIIVQERTAMAQFIRGKDYIVINEEGLVLEIRREPLETTLVDNIKVKRAQPNEIIEIKNKDRYNKTMNLINAADAGDLFFKKIIVDGNDVQAYVYDELVCVGKYDDVMKSIESETLKAAIFTLYQKDIKSGTINIGRNNYCSFTR